MRAGRHLCAERLSSFTSPNPGEAVDAVEDRPQTLGEQPFGRRERDNQQRLLKDENEPEQTPWRSTMPLELIVGAAVGAAAANPSVRKVLRQGMIYGLGGLL